MRHNSGTITRTAGPVSVPLFRHCTIDSETCHIVAPIPGIPDIIPGIPDELLNAVWSVFDTILGFELNVKYLINDFCLSRHTSRGKQFNNH